MAEFFSMGGYAGFVWTAYGVTALVIAGLVIAASVDITTQKKRLAALENEGSRKRAPARASVRKPAEQ